MSKLTKEQKAAVTPPRKAPRIVRRFGEYYFYYLLILPLLAWFIIFCYVPMYGVSIAFKDYKIRAGIMASPWEDPLFKNFTRLFNSPVFWQAFKNTIIISSLKILFGFTAPIIFALLINELRNQKFKKTVQTISYLPYFISWVILAGILRDFLGLTGPINFLVKVFGGEPIIFLADPRTYRGVLVISSIWSGVGWSSIIYLAAIAGIDPQLYEAAQLDGDSRWGMIWHVTLPSIRTTISILFIMQMGGILSAGFDQVFNTYNTAVMTVGDILDTYIYRVGLEDMNYPLSSALGLMKNVVGLMLVLFTNAVSKKIGGEDGALL